ncbi:MAG TPA: DUF790 family protein [Ktedonobacterales bacterium]|nr:DUF790 family protein [Ktedonobacterales bacterium]
MLKLTDIRKTTRRVSSGDGRTLHPHFLRDQSLAPRIERAIQYMESMLDRPRRELDQEILMQLFGDHKLARCIVACLAATYRHRSRSFAEMLPTANVKALRERGITNASDLRLWLFRHVNIELPGFVGGVERAPFLAEAGKTLGLEIEQIETLSALDSPEHAILARTGPKPTAADIIARFNSAVVAAILANAPSISITLSKAPAQAEIIRELCALADIEAELAGRKLTLHGRQDALEGWTRHGSRLVRLLSALLTCGLPAQSGEAIIAAPGGGKWYLRLNSDIFTYLGMRPAEDGVADFSLADLLECWRAQDALAAEYSAIRKAGEENGWTLRRAAEPLSLEDAVLPTFFVATRARQRVAFVLAPGTESGASHLAAIAARIPLVTLRVAAANPLRQNGSPHASGLLELTYSARGDLAALPGLLTQAASLAEKSNKAQQLEAAFEQAHEAGVLTEQQLAEALTCAEEALPALLSRSDARRLAKDYYIEYIEGFGLCSVQVLMRARAVARDVASRPDRSESAVQVARMLGRRLREVTGASEGIECLIAYLGAA